MNKLLFPSSEKESRGMSSSEGSPFSFNRLEALPSAPTSLGCLFLGLATPTLVLLPACRA